MKTKLDGLARNEGVGKWWWTSLSCGDSRLSAQEVRLFTLTLSSSLCFSHLHLTASATLSVYNWTAKTYYRSSNRNIGCLLLDNREQHRYRRTQLLGAGGC